MRIKTKVGKIAIVLEALAFAILIRETIKYLSVRSGINFYVNPAILITIPIIFILNILFVFLIIVILEKLKEKNINPSVVKAVESFVLSPDLNWRVLLADSQHEDLNENSIVIKLSYKDTDFLFMGDLPTEGEEKLLASVFNLDSEILKVAHHGSKYSSSEEFLKAVSPEICVIQSGLDNKFNHPHPEAISRLQDLGCQIKNTQDLGTISLFFD